jgi:DNA ligase-1
MKPMLAAREAKPELLFPRWTSAKIDGIRAMVVNGVLLSRTLKPIPNIFTQNEFGCGDLEGLDGELAVGPPNAPDLMQRTTSGVMSEQGEPDVTFWVFDFWTHPSYTYTDRWKMLLNGMDTRFKERHLRVKLLPHVLLYTEQQLAEFESTHVASGFEGIMSRSSDGKYKYGRSTPREQGLVKHKRFADAEAVVIGFEERMHNANEATLDERGYTKRSSHKENMVPMNTLGALVVKDIKSGVTFSIGTGFPDAERQHIWDNRQSYIDQIACYKHFELVGVKDAPRFPVFKGFRHAADVGR